MLHNLGGRGAPSRSIIFRITLFANSLLLERFFLLRFNKGWRRCFQFLQFLNACLGYPQLLGDFCEPL